MGWSGGSSVMVDLARALNVCDLSYYDRQTIYSMMIESLTSLDWDTLDECYGIDPAYDEVYKTKYALEFDDE